MNHYASCKLNEGKTLDAFALAQTAVSLARSAFPSDFKEGNHQIPGGFVENRPFLRCLYQLMIAQACINEFLAAITTGFQMLDYDFEDRMGARLELPRYLLKQGFYQKAVELFEDERFEDTFHSANYLYPLALLGAGKEDEAGVAIGDCLSKPRIAKYLLNPHLPEPEPEKPFFGIVSGSDLEGFYYAHQYRSMWEAVPEALAMLRAQAREAEAQNWPAYFRSE
ncbi:hypothetical protein [Luteolibacter algae]